MFKRIDHIELLTAAPERAVAFYAGVLGFCERERLRRPNGGRTGRPMRVPTGAASASVRNGRVLVRLVVPRGSAASPGRPV